MGLGMHGEEKRKAEWEKRPKGRRIEWESVDLGKGRRGELGLGGLVIGRSR
jgi:hypothetical protein